MAWDDFEAQYPGGEGAPPRTCFLGYADPDPIRRHMLCTKNGHEWSDWEFFEAPRLSKIVLGGRGRAHRRRLAPGIGQRRLCTMCGKWETIAPS